MRKIGKAVKKGIFKLIVKINGKNATFTINCNVRKERINFLKIVF